MVDTFGRLDAGEDDVSLSAWYGTKSEGAYTDAQEDNPYNPTDEINNHTDEINPDEGYVIDSGFRDIPAEDDNNPGEDYSLEEGTDDSPAEDDAPKLKKGWKPRSLNTIGTDRFVAT